MGEFKAQPDAPVWASAQRPTMPDTWMQDGNAFWILGQAAKAQSRAGWTAEQKQAWHTEATSGDYDHVLQTVLAWHDMPGDDDD